MRSYARIVRIGARWHAWPACGLARVRETPAKAAWQLQRDSQLSFTEYYVLAILSDRPVRRMRMGELAVMADSELSRLSHMVSRLENRGFLCREPDPGNGRYTHAILTDSMPEHGGTANAGLAVRPEESTSSH
jgi:hypothetical protein